MLLSAINDYIETVLSEVERIPEERKALAMNVVRYIQERKNSGKAVDMVFICTHNSRRSIFGQVWAAVAAHYFSIPDVRTWSGGTEATAFNPNAIAALRRVGFEINSSEQDPGPNPKYLVRYADNGQPLQCFSKQFSDSHNPASDFAAIMTCSDAEKNCPFIPGAQLRVGLSYNDPRLFDGTPREEEAYDECCKRIACEALWIFSQIC